MASTGIYFVSALFVLALGQAPSKASECSYEIITNCYLDNINPGDCHFDRAELKCLEAINQSTCAADDLKELNTALETVRKLAAECPGLPDGTCYFNAMMTCEVDVPFTLPFFEDFYTDGEKREKCSRIKGKEDNRTACLTSLKSKCKAHYILEEMDEEIADLAKIKSICANF